MEGFYEFNSIEETIAPFPEEFVVSILALTHTKLPVKLNDDIVVLKSEVRVVFEISNQSSSVGVVASEPCIFIVPLKSSVESPLFTT